ncbi:MAG: LysM peptidoglycan-binding domain-containing protein [Chloroflexota bacterium]
MRLGTARLTFKRVITGLLAIFVITFVIAAVQVVRVHALPPQQDTPPVIPQPPQPDGSIIHEVRKGDTLFGIAVAYKISVDELRKLNNLSPDVPTLFVGKKLIIKLAPQSTLPPNVTVVIVTATFTPNPNATAPAESTAGATDSPAAASTLTIRPTTPPTSVPPTATAAQSLVPPTATLIPLNGKSSVCVTAFNDVNTNHWQDAEDKLLPDVELDLSQGSDQTRKLLTNANTPSCFTDLPSGTFTVMALPPADYGLTTPGQLEVELKAGTQLKLAIGLAQGYTADAAATDEASLVATSAPPTNRSSLIDTVSNNSGLIVLALAGLILIGGIGVAMLIRRS